jgi:hypothetical protein
LGRAHRPRKPHESPGRPASQQKAGASITEGANARAHLPSHSVLPELRHSHAVCTLNPEDRRITNRKRLSAARVEFRLQRRLNLRSWKWPSYSRRFLQTGGFVIASTDVATAKAKSAAFRRLRRITANAAVNAIEVLGTTADGRVVPDYTCKRGTFLPLRLLARTSARIALRQCRAVHLIA